MLLATAIVAVFLAIFAKRTIEYRQSLACADAIVQVGGTVHWNPEVVETLVRDQTIARITDVRLIDPRIDAKDWNRLLNLPMRFGLHIEGKTFTDESLEALANVRRLSYLVLTRTTVDEGDVIRFQSARPDVHVMFGYPGDDDFRRFPARSR
jgi:hypothetical protein